MTRKAKTRKEKILYLSAVDAKAIWGQIFIFGIHAICLEYKGVDPVLLVLIKTYAQKNIGQIIRRPYPLTRGKAMKLFCFKACSFPYLALLIIVFGIAACSGDNDIYEKPVCEQGINNSVCSGALVEDSIWGFGPLNTSVQIDGETIEVTISHFYKFYSADQTYEHYIFLTDPSSNSYFTERRYGNINLLNNGTEIEFTLIESSCSGEDSFFSIFDKSGEKLEVIRDGNTLILNIPRRTFLDDYLSSIEPKITTLKEVVLIPFFVFHYFMAALFSAVLDFFTPEFMETFVTGSLWYNDNTNILFQERYDNIIEGCFSEEGIPRFIIN